MASDGQPPICGLDGNPDLSGLGIRAAFYIQSVTFAVAGEFLPAEAAYLHSSAIALLLATFVVLVRETIMGSLPAPEVAVVMWLFSIQMFAAGRTLKDAVGTAAVADQARSMIHLVVLFSFLGYATWFWFAGLDTLPRTACDEYGFFFSKVDLRGWFRTVNKVVFCIMLVPAGFLALFFVISWIRLGVRHSVALIKGQKREKPKGNRAPVSDRLDSETEDLFPSPQSLLGENQADQNAAGQQFVVSFVLTTGFLIQAAVTALASLALMVPAVELSIQWNQIRGVQALDSVGQLVPFILALGQFAHVAYSTLRAKLYVEIEAESLGDIPGCPKKGAYPDEEHHELLHPPPQISTTDPA